MSLGCPYLNFIECSVCRHNDDAATNQAVVPLTPPRDVEVDLHIKAFVGYKNSCVFTFSLAACLLECYRICRLTLETRCALDSKLA